MKCLLRKANPDELFKYFSKSLACCSSLKPQYYTRLSGNLSLVLEMFPFWCLINLFLRFLENPE